MSKSRASRKFSQLDEDVKYVQVFYEGQHNDARTNLAIALSAAEEGAAVANHTEMIGVLFDQDGGKAVGVTCRDNLDGREYNVMAKCIIFAGGPFTDSMRKLENPDMKVALSELSGWPTFPQLFVKGKLLGGCDIAVDMHENGQLLDALDVNA
jgi:glycerol-3-phosphate dehydrogenase